MKGYVSDLNRVGKRVGAARDSGIAAEYDIIIVGGGA